MKGNDRKIIEIQCLRGYAILITIIAHLATLIPQLSPVLSYFWLGGGVDLFFCISGFVIARGLLLASKASFLEFYVSFLIKRIARLWPAAIFWSFIVLGLCLFFNSSHSFSSFSDNLASAVAGWLNIENFKIVSCSYYKYANCHSGSPLRVYWSLSLEEQFYLVFPILLFFIGNKKTVLFACVLTLIQLFLYRPWPSPLWFFRTDALCLGIIIAWLHQMDITRLIEPVLLRTALVRTITTLSLCALLFLVARIEIVWFFNGLVAIISALLVFLASYDKSYLFHSLWLKKILAYIGERSYSMYLTHMVCLVFLKEVNFRMGIKVSLSPYFLGGQIVLLGLFILLASEFSYRYIEQPFRKKGKRRADNWIQTMEQSLCSRTEQASPIG